MNDFIKNLFTSSEPKDLGALPDPRTEEEKLKDYKFEEIVASANPVNWKEKDWDDVRQFPVFDQDGSGSCVAQTMAKLLGIIYWLKNNSYVHFSATHVYQRRNNKPAGGMAGVDAFEIARNGATLEELVPSQKMTDSQMDSIVIPKYKHQVGEIFKIGNYVQVPVRDIETIASIIQTTKKGVMVWFYFKHDEWTKEVPTVKYPTLDIYAASTSRHSVTATDFLLYKGKKAIVIEDSWGVNTGNEGRRIITEDFFKARNWFAAYPIDFKFEDQTQPSPTPTPTPTPDPTKPKYTFTKTLKFGDSPQAPLPDVVALQNILKYEGTFPKNINSTGYYGAVTAKAVYDFQVKHNVASMAELNSLQGRLCGVKTIAKLNQLYSN